MKTPDDAWTSQEQETHDGFIVLSDDWTFPDEEIADEHRSEGGFGGDRNGQESGEIAVDMGGGNGNEERRNVLNEDDNDDDHNDDDHNDDHDDDRDYEFVRPVSSSESECEYEEIDCDGNCVGQEPWTIVGAGKEGKGDGRENEEAIGPENEVQVLPTVPPAAVSLQATLDMLPLGVVTAVTGNQVIVRVTTDDIPPVNKGSNLWVTEPKSLLGVIDGTFPGKTSLYVRCNSDSNARWIKRNTSVSIVPELADRVHSDKDEKVSCEADRQNDQRQRNNTENRQAPSDKTLNTSGSSSGSRAPAHEDISRANAGPSQSRGTHGNHPPAPSTTADLSNQFDSMAMGQVPTAGAPGFSTPHPLVPAPALPRYVPPAFGQQNPVWPLPGRAVRVQHEPISGPSEALHGQRTRDSSRQPNKGPSSANRHGAASRGKTGGNAGGGRGQNRK